MPSAKTTDFVIRSITGYNDSDPPTEIPEDQATVATNVEFYESAMGERRLGCTDVDLPVSITGNANIQAIPFLYRNLPTTDETASELWVLGSHLTTQNFQMTRKTTAWASVTFKDDPDITSNRVFGINAQSLHGKLFISFRSVGGVDRLHVVDTSTTFVRRCGLAEPAAPTGADAGVGAFSGVRYYRVRYTVQSAGSTVLRSEPSEVLTHTPAGTGASVTVTKPASISENETHWELEASTDNANFYRIATTLVGTTTASDTTDYTSGYANASGSVLSEDIGDYSLIHSGKFLAADEDRLIIGGSWEDSELASRVSWTPVYNDPGVGNDERIPTDTVNFLDLDGFEGGPLTGLSNPVNGSIWAFKRSHVYQLVRTGIRDRAYQSYNISKSIGAIEGSVVAGVDQYGMPCLYFLDPRIGPCRTGGNKVIQTVSRDIITTWESVNLDAIVTCRSIYYPKKQQVIWYITTASASFPNVKLTLQTGNTREGIDGVRGGWAKSTGKIAEAYSACLFSDNIDDNTTRSLELVPFIGVTSGNGYVLRCDTGSDDNGTAFSGRIVSKPFILKGLLNQFKILNAALLAEAHATADINITLIRDFGAEEPRTVETALAAVGSETDVVKKLKSLTGTGFRAVQVEFEDVASPSGQWRLNRFDMRLEDAGDS
jgi:hypothetical protein